MRYLSAICRFAIVLSFFCVAPTIRAQDPAKNATDAQSRIKLADQIKGRLVKEMTNEPIKAERRDRDTTKIASPFKDIMIHTDWSVSVNGQFDDLAKKFQLDLSASGARRKMASIMSTLSYRHRSPARNRPISYCPEKLGLVVKR